MRLAAILLCSILLQLGAYGIASAWVATSYPLALARAPHALAPDASLQDPAWAAGQLAPTAWENETTRAAAAEETRVYALYDDANVYVAFVAQQRTEPIVATQTANEVGFGTDDFVGVGIDTNGSGSQTYFFETTPRGVRYEQASENTRFRPEWRASAQIGDGVWRAVLIVPLKAMRFPPGPQQNWRVNFFRNLASRGEHLTWAFDPTMQDAPPGSWPAFNDVRFWPRTSGIKLARTNSTRPKPRLEIYGLASGGRDRDRYEQAGGVFAAQHTRSLGADVSVPLTSTINFVGTIAPDFSNVEVDQQTIVPQEFARQLSEYRPFFAQGAQYINASPAGYSTFNGPQDRLFYSRSIGPFDSGAKVEGTYGLQRFGILAFRGFDQVTGERFDDQAFGYRHALPDTSFEYWFDAVSAHHSKSGNDTAYEAGTLFYNPHSGLEWATNAAVEHGALTASAHSMRSFVFLGKPNFQAVVQYGSVSRGYGPIDGFTTIDDVRGPAGYVNFNGATTGALKNWSVFFLGDRLLNREGLLRQTDAQMLINATFRSGFSLNGLGPTGSQLRLNGNVVPFNLMNVPVGLGDGTPHPLDASASWGNFGGNDVHLYSVQSSRPMGSRYTIGVEYGGSYERSLKSGVLDSQWLRRLSLGLNLGPSSNLTFSVRSINGRVAFAADPGVNFSAAYHLQTSTGDLYVNFGSPSAIATLDRLIVKYVLRIGAAAGT